MIGSFLLVIHIVISIALILVVLLQSSKGGGLAGAFGGGGGGGTVFGGRETATFLEKATRYLAVGFMVTSLALAFSQKGTRSEDVDSAIRRAAMQTQGVVTPQDQTSIQDFLEAAPEGESQEGDAGGTGGGASDAPAGEESPGDGGG